MKFIIDAGHGGSGRNGDPGAIGPTGLKEKDVNLSIATRLASIAMMRGHFPVLTRMRDEFQSLKYRTDYANREGGRCFVSIHCNSFTSPVPEGFEVFSYRAGSQASSDLAECVISAWRLSFPSHVIRGHKKSGFYVIAKTKMPAILLETAFIKNPAWEPWLRDEKNHQAMAETIMAGIEAWGGGIK